MTIGWVLILLWLVSSALVGCLFSLLVMSSRQDDEMRALARRPDRYLTYVKGGVELRRPPFDFERGDAA